MCLLSLSIYLSMMLNARSILHIMQFKKHIMQFKKHIMQLKNNKTPEKKH